MKNGSAKITKKRILVVDDDPDIILTVRTGLEKSGLFYVDTYDDPDRALFNFRVGIYDMILLDFMMAKTTGYELHDKIRQIDPGAKICFLSATFPKYEEARKPFPMLEINCFIPKPVQIKDLIRKINAELEKH